MSHNASAAIKVVFPFPLATCMTPSLTRRRPSSTHRQPHRFARTHSCQSASVNFLPVSSPTRVSVATKSSSLSTDSQSMTRSVRSRSVRKRRAAAWIHRPASLPSRMASTSANVRVSAFTIRLPRQVMRVPPQIRPKVTPPLHMRFTIRICRFAVALLVARAAQASEIVPVVRQVRRDASRDDVMHLLGHGTAVDAPRRRPQVDATHPTPLRMRAC